MNQLIIEIFDVHEPKKSWGWKKVTQMNWNNGYCNYIEVDWYGDGKECMSMNDYDGSGRYYNVHKNLTGIIEL